MIKRQALMLLAAVLSLGVVAGCGDDKGKDKPDPKKKAAAGHPDHGPKGGHLFKLVADDGSAVQVEVIEEHDKKLTAVLMADDVKTERQSAAPEATLEVTDGSDKKSFKLKAEAKDGKASHYSSTESDMLEATEKKGAKLLLIVEVDGKTHKGSIEHMEH